LAFKIKQYLVSVAELFSVFTEERILWFFFEEEFSDTGFVVNNQNDNALVQSQCKLLTLQKACVKY